VDFSLNAYFYRARQNYLYEKFAQGIQATDRNEIYDQFNAALQHFRNKSKTEPDPDKSNLYNEMVNL
jgi:hypothetical protein